MKRLTTIIWGLLFTTSLTATAAYAQNTPSTAPQNSPPSIKSDADGINNTTRMLLRDANGKEIGEVEVVKNEDGRLVLINSSGLTNGLNAVDFSPDLWLVVLLTITCGGLGGVVFELLNLQGNIERPHKPTDDELAAKLAYASRKHVIDLGIWARVIVGAAAAPPAMLFLRPETAFGLLAMSVVAGSAGTAVFRSLQERLLLAVAQQGKVESETPAMKQNTKLDEAIDTFEKLEQKVRKVSVSEPKTTILSFPKGLTLEPKDFNQIWKLLIEANCVENAKVDEAIHALQNLERKVRDVSESPFGTTELRIPSDKTLDSKDFDEVKRRLGEAKGLSETIVTREAQEVSDTAATADSSTTPPLKPYDLNPAAKLDEAINAFAQLKEKLIKTSTRGADTMTLQLSSSNFLEQEDLDKVQKLLSELKGLFSTTRISGSSTSSELPGVEIAAKVNQAADAFEALKNKLMQASNSLVGTTILKFADGTSIQLSDLDKVEKLLCEVKGLQQKIGIPNTSTLLQQPPSEIALSEAAREYHVVR